MIANVGKLRFSHQGKIDLEEARFLGGLTIVKTWIEQGEFLVMKIFMKIIFCIKKELWIL